MNLNTELLANSLIGLVRNRVDADQWDEGKEGVKWLENELGFVDELISAYDGSNPDPLKGLSTVVDFKNWLSARTPSYLMAQCRLNQLGGTESPHLRTIVNEIRATQQITDTQREFLSYFINDYLF